MSPFGQRALPAQLRLASQYPLLCSEDRMATLTIHNFDDALAEELRRRASDNCRSVEAEVEEIVRTTLSNPRIDMVMSARLI